MRLYEFAENDPLRIKLVTVMSQLRAKVENGDINDFSTDELLDLLRKNGVGIDKSDLFDIVSKDPLKNIIKNISGHKVIFVNQDDDFTSSEDENGEMPGEDTVAKMAKRAMK